MAQRRIYLVRHGVAEDDSDSGRDFDRHLTPEGQEKMARAAVGLRTLGVEVDVLVSSPLVRAIETADEIVARLRAALDHIDADRLMAAPDCGLIMLGADLARAKLGRLVEAARAV